VPRDSGPLHGGNAPSRIARKLKLLGGPSSEADDRAEGERTAPDVCFLLPATLSSKSICLSSVGQRVTQGVNCSGNFLSHRIAL
jgi:hypothetical protein